MATEPRLYYVEGKGWYGERVVVKTYAYSPAEARDNAQWKFNWDSKGIVRRG